MYFFWNHTSKLTKERQQEIKKWMDSLSEEDQKKLEELIKDVRVEEQYDSFID